MDDANKKFIARVRSGATRLRKSAESVTTDAEFQRFARRLSDWQCGQAWQVSSLLGQPEWDATIARELMATAQAALESASATRQSDRRWEIERLEVRERAERSRPMDAATRQYQAEVRASFSLAE